MTARGRSATLSSPRPPAAFRFPHCLLTDNLCTVNLCVDQMPGGTMWEHEHSIETTAAPAAVWRHWFGRAAWPQWNDGIEKIAIDGPFEAGTTFTMTPPGDEPIRMRLT